MKKLLFIVLTGLIIFNGFSQEKQYSTLKQYYFKDYQEADVFFKDNKQTKLKLNYNVLLDEMHYLQYSKKVKVGNLNDIILVKFENENFIVKDDGFYKLIYAGKNKVYLKFTPDLNVLYKPEEGAYGSSSQTSSVGKYSSIEERTYMVSLLMDPDSDNEVNIPVYNRFMVDVDGELTNLTKSVLLNKIFNNSKSKVKEYLKVNKINLNVPEDIEKVFAYGESL